MSNQEMPAQELPTEEAAAPPPSGGGWAGRNRNRLIMLGGGAAAVVAVVVIVLVVFLLRGGGLSAPGQLLGAVPDDTRSLQIWKYRQIISGAAPQDVQDSAESGAERFEDIGISLENLNSVIYATAPDGVYVLADGNFDFDDIRNALELDYGFTEDSHRGYETWVQGNWSGYRAVGLLEEAGYLFASESNSGLEEVIKRIERESGLLDDADDDLELKRILDAVADGWRVDAYASSGSNCGSRVYRCQAWAVAINANDEESLKADFVLLFSTEAAAEEAAEDFDDVADYVEAIPFWPGSEGNVDEVEGSGDLVRIKSELYTSGSASAEDRTARVEVTPAPGVTRAVVAPTADMVRGGGGSMAQAVLIDPGQVAQGEIRFGNREEYFSFYAERGATYNIEIDSGSLSDTYMKLYDSDGDVVEQDDDGGSGGASALYEWSPFASGIYFVEITAYSSGDTGTYRLLVTDVAMERENFLARAMPIQVGEVIEGEIEFSSRENLFSFHAERGAEYDIETDTGTLTDTYLRLYDPDGDVVAENDDGGSNGGSGVFGWTPFASGTHYVEITGYSGRTGTYRLLVTDVAMEREAFLARAVPIPVGEVVEGEIGSSDRENLFSFHAERGVEYDIETDTGTLTDTYLRLYDPDGDVIAENDDGGSNGGSGVFGWTPFASGTHYVEITGHSGRTGTYRLLVTD